MQDRKLSRAITRGIFAATLLLSVIPAQAQVPPPPSADFEVFASLRTNLVQNGRYDKALTVMVVDSRREPVEGAVVTATALGKSADKIGLFTNFKAEGKPSAELSTDQKGLAMFGVETKGLDPNQARQDIRILVSVKYGKAPEAREAIVLGEVIEKSPQALGSDRMSFELFTGATMARTYDENGKSTGFDDVSPVGRVRFDTLWGRNRPLAFHTGFELQFSSFPTATAPAIGGGTNPDKFTKYSDSYTGSLVLIYQPGHEWAHSYSDTSHNIDSKLHYDAIRHGVTGRVSVISRDIKDKNADTDVLSARLGYLFTHHQTAASEAIYDDVNVFPARFVEISYAYYESIFGRENEDRLVVEAGLRVPGLGTDVIPFYGGVYLNAGKGQDDFRVFAGFLFQINRLRNAF